MYLHFFFSQQFFLGAQDIPATFEKHGKTFTGAVPSHLMYEATNPETVHTLIWNNTISIVASPSSWFVIPSIQPINLLFFLYKKIYKKIKLEKSAQGNDQLQTNVVFEHNTS